MGFWNIKARELCEGDEIRTKVMGNEEYLTVVEVEAVGDKVTVTSQIGSPVTEWITQALPATEPLTVRR
jgi:hypothetical protein